MGLIPVLFQGQASALIQIGRIQYAQGKYRDAINNLTRASDIFQYLQEPLGRAQALNYLGDVYQAQGDKEEALDTYNQALIAYGSVQNRLGEAASLKRIALVHQSIAVASHLRTKSEVEENPRQGIASFHSVLTCITTTISARASKPKPWPLCATCGHRLQSKGWHPRQMQTLVGSIF